MKCKQVDLLDKDNLLLLMRSKLNQHVNDVLKMILLEDLFIEEKEEKGIET